MKWTVFEKYWNNLGSIYLLKTKHKPFIASKIETQVLLLIDKETPETQLRLINFIFSSKQCLRVDEHLAISAWIIDLLIDLWKGNPWNNPMRQVTLRDILFSSGKFRSPGEAIENCQQDKGRAIICHHFSVWTAREKSHQRTEDLILGDEFSDHEW